MALTWLSSVSAKRSLVGTPLYMRVDYQDGADAKQQLKVLEQHLEGLIARTAHLSTRTKAKAHRWHRAEALIPMTIAVVSACSVIFSGGNLGAVAFVTKGSGDDGKASAVPLGDMAKLMTLVIACLDLLFSVLVVAMKGFVTYLRPATHATIQAEIGRLYGHLSDDLRSRYSKVPISTPPANWLSQIDAIVTFGGQCEKYISDLEGNEGLEPGVATTEEQAATDIRPVFPGENAPPSWMFVERSALKEAEEDDKVYENDLRSPMPPLSKKTTAAPPAANKATASTSASASASTSASASASARDGSTGGDVEAPRRPAPAARVPAPT